MSWSRSAASTTFWSISMRTISRTTRFKKDYKRESKGQHCLTLDADLVAVLTLLVDDTPLPERFHDHSLAAE